MKLMYQSIFACFFLLAIASMSGYKYTFYNKTDVALYVEYFIQKFSKDVFASFTIDPASNISLSTESGLCIREIKISDVSPEKKYKKIKDPNIFPHCYDKEWDIVVIENKLDLVNHSDKNKNILEQTAKPSRTISIG